MRPEHLRVQLRLQRIGVFHHRFGVAVLRFQILDGVGIVAIAQPEIVVDARVAQRGDRLGNNLGDGRHQVGSKQGSGHEGEQNSRAKHPLLG